MPRGGGTSSPSLANLADLTDTGLVAHTTSTAWAARTLTPPAAGVDISDGDGVSGNPTLALANDLAAVEGISTAGMAARTASDTWTTRAITGTAAQISIANGDGVSGAPTLSLPDPTTTPGDLNAGTATGDVFNAAGYLEWRDARLEVFCVQIRNSGGTIQHRIVQGLSGAAATFDTKITSPSTGYNATPAVDSGTGFTTGGGLDAGSAQRIVFNNAAAQSAVGLQRVMAVILFNGTGTEVSVEPFISNIDVDGTTQNRQGLRCWDSSGAAFNINSTNIGSGKALVLAIFGFIN